MENEGVNLKWDGVKW